MKKILAALSILLFFATYASALVIYADNFDNNTTKLAGWARTSTTYITRYTGSYKVGTGALQLRKNYVATTYLKTGMFKNMVLTFKMAASSLEKGEYLRCQYMTGTSWVTAKTLSDGSDNGVYRSYSVSIPNCSILKIRFYMYASGTDDYGYIDDVQLTGDRK